MSPLPPADTSAANNAAMPTCVRLMLVDDHNLFRRGLRALLAQDDRLEVVCEAGDVGEALRCLEKDQPDVILLDNHLPGVRGVDGIASIKESAQTAKVLMLTVSEDEKDLAAALQAGADGYLLKTVESDQLIDTIFKVLDGESVISPEMMTKLVSVFRARRSPASTPGGVGGAQTPQATEAQAQGAGAAAVAADGPEDEALSSLSPREREILVLIAKGESNKLIARGLDIAETTVKIHVQHILRKLELNSRVQAAVYATNHGLV
ncbi:response regulator [Hydrogenophaga sp. 5NK40-0174]|uniref:response regulator n=1 Tax=Hydrogenophaga sp. 5NK40-0174 TaxID=3127649 RepID=UPI00310B2CBD